MTPRSSASSPASEPRSGAADRDTHFKDWPQGADPASVVDRVSRVFANENLNASKHYKVACAWYGSLAVSAISKNQTRLDGLIAKYAPYKGTWSTLLGGGLQVQAYRVSKDTKYLDAGASVMVEYLNRLQQSDGLFFHHEDFHHEWARGNGWFAAGMAEIIRELPQTHRDYATIRQGYEKMMSGLVGYQINADAGAGAGLPWRALRGWPSSPS